MTANIGTLDRIVRFIIGTMIVVYALPLGINSVVWHWIGIAGTLLVVTAMYRKCPAYRWLGVSTRRDDAVAVRRTA